MVNGRLEAQTGSPSFLFVDILTTSKRVPVAESHWTRTLSGESSWFQFHAFRRAHGANFLWPPDRQGVSHFYSMEYFSEEGNFVRVYLAEGT